jgi:ribosome recycling factor
MVKMKLGRMDPTIFESIYVKAYGESSKVSDLAQIVEKNMNTCIINPYSE